MVCIFCRNEFYDHENMLLLWMPYCQIILLLSLSYCNPRLHFYDQDCYRITPLSICFRAFHKTFLKSFIPFVRQKGGEIIPSLPLFPHNIPRGPISKLLQHDSAQPLPSDLEKNGWPRRCRSRWKAPTFSILTPLKTTLRKHRFSNFFIQRKPPP